MSTPDRYHPAETDRDREKGTTTYNCHRCRQPTVISTSYAAALRESHMFPGLCNLCWAPIAEADLRRAKLALREETIRARGAAIRARLTGVPVPNARHRYVEGPFGLEDATEEDARQTQREITQRALRRHQAKIDAREQAAFRKSQHALAQAVGPQRAAEMLYLASEEPRPESREAWEVWNAERLDGFPDTNDGAWND